MIVEKKSPSRILFLAADYLILILIALICLIPLVHVIMASISDPGMVETNKGLIIRPLGGSSLNGYRYLLQYKSIWVGYRNTIFYVIMQCLITGCLTVVAGYCLSRKRFRYRNVVMAFISFTMLFNGGMIPTYIVVRTLKLLDTRAAVLIPTALSVFYIIIMRTSIAQIPDSLEESARIDGAGELTIMFRIILPLCKATFAVIILFVAVGKWNEWFTALLYLSDRGKYPLQMFMREILIKGDTVTADEAMNQLQSYKTLVKYCSIVVATLPIMCVYPFVQKYFVSGVMIGSVKG